MVVFALLATGLGVVFLLSAVGKIADPQGFSSAVHEYRALPSPIARAYAVMLPPAELLAAASLIVGVGVRTSAAAVVLMLVSFCIAVGLNLWRQRDLDCHCFGNRMKRRIGRVLLLQDIGLLAVAGVAVTGGTWAGAEPYSLASIIDKIPSIGHVGPALAAAFGAAALYASSTLARRHREPSGDGAARANLTAREPALSRTMFEEGANRTRPGDGQRPSAVRMSRRRLLGLVAAGASALAFGGFVPRLGIAYATCGPPYDKYTGQTWWGSHLATHYLPGKNVPQQFYLYPGGTETTTAPYEFDPVAATAATPEGTYMYWDLWGASPTGNASPPDYPTCEDAYNWGYQQAEAAVSAWWNNTYASYTRGLTIFGTIIPTSKPKPPKYPNGANLNGWAQAYNQAISPWADLNQCVLRGWQDGIANYSFDGKPFRSGLYTSHGNWDLAFGSGYLAENFVLWLSADCWSACGAVNNVPCKYLAPCFPCDTGCGQTECDVEVMMVGAVEAACGGYQTVIWHYWNECTCRNGSITQPCQETLNGQSYLSDYDVAVKDPINGGYGFEPLPYTPDPNCPSTYPSGSGENGCGGCACNKCDICT